MPEGDTVHVAAARLRRALVGHPVARFDLRVPALALVDLTGTDVTAVQAVGKHLLMRFSDGSTLHSHLRMDGSWRVRPAADSPPGREFEIRAVVGTSENTAYGFRVHDLAVLPTARESDLVGHLGPDLAAETFDRELALRRLAEQPPDRPIGEALLDQRPVAGIGNVYKSELLFLHRIDPWSPIGRQNDLGPLVDDARRLLRGNLRDYNRSTTGWHQPGQQYWVYGREGKACRRCRHAVAKAMQGDNLQERVTYFCPSCQNTSAPPDRVRTGRAG